MLLSRRQRLLTAFGIALLLSIGHPARTQTPTILSTMGFINPTTTPEPQPIKIWPDIRIHINIPATTLSVYKDNTLTQHYRISVGSQGHQSPVMQSTFNKLIWNPDWIPPPDSAWAAGLKPEPPGPRNPLGPVKMLLDSGIRIHGTTKDGSIGRAASHGCFRMHSQDAAALAWFLQQNLSEKTDDSYRQKYVKNRRTTFVVPLMADVPVEIVYVPTEIADNALILHPDLYGRAGKLKDRVLAAVGPLGITESDIPPATWKALISASKKGSFTFPITALTIPPPEEFPNS